MKKQILGNRLVAIVLLFAIMVTSIAIVLAELPTIAFADSSQASDSEIDMLRYGYDVTGGTSIMDGGLKTQYPILKADDNSQTSWARSVRTNTHNIGPSVGLAYTGYSVEELAQQYGKQISGGIGGKIQMVNLDIAAAFDRTSGTSQVYSERYDTYFQNIIQYNIEIQGNIDLSKHLSDDFRGEITQVNDSNATALLKKYGTHLFTGFQMGGYLEINNYMKTTQYVENFESYDSLGARVGVAMGNATKGINGDINFSYSSVYQEEEKRMFETSTYKVRIYGGKDKPAALTMESLFTYNPSLLDGKGGYEYGVWVDSVSRNENLAVVGVPEGNYSIPLWELIPSDIDPLTSSNIKTALIEAYAEMCGDSYNEYLEKYPTRERVIGEEAANSHASILGYTTIYKDNVSYTEESDTLTNRPVAPSTTIYMNTAGESITAGNKNWRITAGGEFAEMEDAVAGIFKIKPDAPAGKKITVALFDGDTQIPNASKNFTTVSGGNFSGGEGTEEKPYLISTLEDLKNIARQKSTGGLYFKLTKNIECNNEEIGGIGTEASPFAGTFDGNNFVISNYKMTSPNEGRLGLFTYNTGTIKNVTLVSGEVGCGDNKTDVAISNVGAIVAYNKGTVSNCKVSGLTIAVKYTPDKEAKDNVMYVGGIAGVNANLIDQCVVENVTKIEVSLDGATTNNGASKVSAGGIVGFLDKATMQYCFANSIEEINSYAKSYKTYVFSGGAVGSTMGNAKMDEIVVGATPNLLADGKNWMLSTGNEEETGLLVGFVWEDEVDKDTILKLTATDCYVKENGDYQTGVESCTVLQNISFADCKTLDVEIWCTANGALALKKQTFDAATVLDIDTSNAKTEFYYGEEFNVSGVIVKARYAGSADLFDVPIYSVDYSNYDPKVEGDYDIIITAFGYSKKYTVTVRKMKVVALEVKRNDESQTLYAEDEANEADYKAMYVLENGDEIDPASTEKLPYVQYPTNKITFEGSQYVLGDNKVTFNCGDIKGSLVVEATERVLEGIEIVTKPTKLNYFVNQTVNFDGLEVKAIYSDKTEMVALKDLEIIMGSKVVEGENTIILSYGNYKLASFTVMGEPVPQTIYTVTFVDEDGTEISSKQYNEGATIEVPANPTKAADKTYTYTFAGWDKAVSPTATADVTYKATYAPTYIEYTVKFVDYDDKVLSTGIYHFDDTIVVPANPTRESDGTYSYEFSMWSGFVAKVSGNHVFKATYSKTLLPTAGESTQKYNVIFYDADGTVISSATYSLGDTVVIPASPTKASDNTYNYTFAGWSTPVQTICNGYAAYVATYDSTYIEYTIKFVNWDGEVISTRIYHYNDPVEIPTATRPATNTYKYTFSGWDKTVSTTCTGNATYTANFDASFVEYVVMFKDWDGSVISQKTYHYGEAIAVPAVPTRQSDGQFNYSFEKWSGLTATVTSSCEIVASYKATPIGEADDPAIDDEKPGDSQVDLEEIAKLIEIMESAKKTMVTMLVINCAAFAIFAAIGVVVIIKQYHK